MAVPRDTDDDRTTRSPPVEAPGHGMWGTVRVVTGDTVRVATDDFDDGTHTFGPVPTIGATPAPGARAFLHFDQRDRPAYAVIFDA